LVNYSLSVCIFPLSFIGNVESSRKVSCACLFGRYFHEFIWQKSSCHFLINDDIQQRGITVFSLQKFSNPSPEFVSDKENHIPRSQLYLKTAVVVELLLIVAMSWGFYLGAHDYRVRRINVAMPICQKLLKDSKCAGFRYPFCSFCE